MQTSIRVLYVDDSRFDRELVRDALEQEHGGFEVVEAGSRVEFEKRLETQTFDVVLSDFNIGGFEGLQVLDAVKQMDPTLPVVIVTGTGSEEVAVESMKRGAADYVIKTPQHIRKLPRTIVSAIEKKQLDLSRRLAESALRKSELHFRALIDNALDLIVIIDVGGVFGFLSPSVKRLLGYEVDDLLGKRIFDFVHPGDLPSLSNAFQSSVKRGDVVTSSEFRIRHADGSWRTFEAMGKSLGEENGVLRGVINARDVTDRKTLSKQLLEIADRERRSIGQDLHDGVGQLLAAMGFRIAALENRMRTHDETVADQISEVGELVESVIAETRAIAQGLNPIQMNSVGLHVALEHLSNQFRTLFDVECVVEDDGAVNVTDMERATHIYRIAQEASSNAARHAGASRIVISLSEEEGMACLAIEDDGRKNIDPQTLVRSEGMGMHIMRHRAEMIGGALEFRNSDNGGLVVECRFQPSKVS